MKQPKFLSNNIFDWTKEFGDYGYPMSVDGHIFRTKDIYQWIKDMDYCNPNTFEGAFVHKRNKVGHYMICYDKSPMLNNPINRVQTVNDNLCGGIAAEFLNEKFLKGATISLENFINLDNTSCHQEIQPIFLNDESSSDQPIEQQEQTGTLPQ